MPGKLFKKWSEAAGVSTNNALAIADKPDRVDAREINGMVVRLATKRVPNTKPPSWVLVATIEMPGGSKADLLFVLRVHDTPEVSALSPTDLLREFVARFGLAVTIGQTTKPLFLAEAVEATVKKPEAMFTFARGKREALGVPIFSYPSHLPVGSPCVVSVAIGFVFELSDYRDYLRGKSETLA